MHRRYILNVIGNTSFVDLRCFFFIASRRPGKAGGFGIGRTPCADAKVYQITPKVAGFSDVP
jgi:hypothetical protein